MKTATAKVFCEEIVHLSDGGTYKRTPPAFHNAVILESKIQNRFLEIWRTDADFPPIQLYRLKDVKMFDVGYLVKNDYLLTESIQHINQAALGLIKNFVSSNLNNSSSQVIPFESFLLKRNSSSNYGHWLIEFLPFIKFYTSERFYHSRLILEFFSKSSFGRVQLDSMKYFKVEESNIIRCSRNKYLLSDVWIPSKCCIHSHIKHPMLIDITRKAGLDIAVHAGKNDRDFLKPTRLFITRKSGHKRRLINENELKVILFDFGFEIFYPEDFSFNEQVVKFSTADVVVGTTGAALTNIVYCKQKCKLISLNPDTGQESFFWDIANLIGIDFSFVFGRSINKGDPHSDFQIEPNDLRQALKINLLESRS